MPDAKIFIVETEATVTRRYRVIVYEGENPWDVWKNERQRILRGCLPQTEKPVSVERIKEGNHGAYTGTVGSFRERYA